MVRPGPDQSDFDELINFLSGLSQISFQRPPSDYDVGGSNIDLWDLAGGGKMLSDFRANSSGSGRSAAVAPEFGAFLFSFLWCSCWCCWCIW